MMNDETSYFGQIEWFLINLSRIINGAVKKFLFINIPVNMKICFATHEHPFWSFLDLSSRKCLQKIIPAFNVQLPTVTQDKHPCPTFKRTRLSLLPTA